MLYIVISAGTSVRGRRQTAGTPGGIYSLSGVQLVPGYTGPGAYNYI